MPRPGVALFLRPNFDMATSYGHYFMGVAARYASARMFVRDLGGVAATKANFDLSLYSDDPEFCYLLGHGNQDTYSAQNQEIVMRTCNGDERLIGRVTLLLSCSCGVSLAPSAVQKGALAVFAWAVDFTWVAVTDPDVDNYARGFFEAVNVISNALADGRTAGRAMDLSMATWERWIDFWVASEDPYASLIVQHMLHDKDGQRLFGDPSARLTVLAAPDVAGIPFSMPMLTGHTIFMLSLIA